MISDTHPTLSELEYVRSETLAEASQFLGQHPDEARPFLGGTDVLVRMRGGFLMPKFLVDIKNLDDTKARAVGGVWGGRLARGQPVNHGILVGQGAGYSSLMRHKSLNMFYLRENVAEWRILLE